jgi:chromate transporter
VQRDPGALTRAAEVLETSLYLGLTSFGGPLAHLGYFERTYVGRLGWLRAEDYGGLVALCQALPGPTSSQVGFLIGLHRAGGVGALAAWLGFTLPSALLLYACALLSAHAQGPIALAVVHGLKLTAVAVVAQALFRMARTLCPDLRTAAVALAAAATLLAFGGERVQLVVLAAGAVAGILFCRGARTVSAPFAMPLGGRTGWLAAGLFALLLFGLPLLSTLDPHGLVALAGVFYRAGALVFGGGHVVLPLLRDALVPQGWISDDGFLAGYGLAQAVPGPLFTVAAYLGAANAWTPTPALAAAVAVLSIFLPGLLIAVAGVALWGRIAGHAVVGGAMTGVNAAVVGILAAALYDPLWTTAIRDGPDVAIAGAGLLLLASGRAPPLVVVMLCTGCSVLRIIGG